jgi:UDP-glucose 4-epimerase
MNILVIGGAGYIGSHVVKALLDRGEDITVFDNLSSGLRENIFPGTEFIQGDILDKDTVFEVMGRRTYDAVIHLAALKAAGESMELPEKYAENNISGTINIVNGITETKIDSFVFSSSAAVYGEPEYIPVDEAHPTDPANFYGFTKLEIERILHWYESLKGLRFAALRYFNAAGYDVNGVVRGLERNPANLLPVIMETAVGKRDILQIFGDDYDTRDGTGIRDYIHVTDLAEAHVLALDYIKDKKRSLTVNLGSEEGISVLEMLETAKTISGKDIPSKIVGRREGDPALLIASSQKAGKLLGWHARYSDVETLVRTSWEVYK